MNNRHVQLLRRRWALTASVTVLVIAAVAAASYAQFSGSGTGTNTVPDGGAGRITVTSPPVGPLTPQINPADTTAVVVTVDNTGSSSADVGEIVGDVPSADGCDGSWFTVAAIPAPGTITPGDHTFHSSVILNDNDRDQTACTSRPITIDWTVEAAGSHSVPPASTAPQVGSFSPGP